MDSYKVWYPVLIRRNKFDDVVPIRLQLLDSLSLYVLFAHLTNLTNRV